MRRAPSRTAFGRATGCPRSSTTSSSSRAGSKGSSPANGAPKSPAERRATRCRLHRIRRLTTDGAATAPRGPGLLTAGAGDADCGAVVSATRRAAAVHPVRGFAPRTGAHSTPRTATVHPARGFAPRTGAPGPDPADSAPASGANPRTRCRPAPETGRTTPARSANPRSRCIPARAADRQRPATRSHRTPTRGPPDDTPSAPRANDLPTGADAPAWPERPGRRASRTGRHNYRPGTGNSGSHPGLTPT